MVVKCRVRCPKIEFTKRHYGTLKGTQFRYKEQARSVVQIKEAIKEIVE